jgi:hypothetical protein
MGPEENHRAGAATEMARDPPNHRRRGASVDQAARRRCARAVDLVHVIGNLAKRKPASASSGDQTDRRPPAGARQQKGSSQTAPRTRIWRETEGGAKSGGRAVRLCFRGHRPC